MKDVREKYCTLRLEEELFNKVTTAAKRANMTRSSYIRQAILAKMNEDVLLSLD